jgi:uncharacterized protein (TIGR03437 family)
MDLRPGNAAVSIEVGEKTFDVGIARMESAAPVIRGVRRGASAVEIYATGLGALNGEIATGAPAPVDRLVRTQGTPSVRIGGQPATVLFSGLAPGRIALYQVNAAVPAGVSPNCSEIELEIAGHVSRIYPE